MKKVSFLFVALAFVGFLSLNACKSTTPAPEAEVEAVVEEAPAVVDSAAAVVDSAAAAVETVAQ